MLSNYDSQAGMLEEIEMVLDLFLMYRGKMREIPARLSNIAVGTHTPDEVRELAINKLRLLFTRLIESVSRPCDSGLDEFEFMQGKFLPLEQRAAILLPVLRTIFEIADREIVKIEEAVGPCDTAF